VERQRGRESTMTMRGICSFKCAANVERRGDFKRDHRIHEVLGELVK
jgi:hypothetical protein